MRIKSLFGYLWKLPLCGIGFFIGMALGGVLLPLFGFTTPAMPEGSDANTILIYFLLGSMLLAIPMSILSKGIASSFLGRWLILSALTWMVGSVGMVLESAFFMDTGAVSSGQSSLFTILNFLLPSLSLSALAALLFRPGEKVTGKGKLFAFFRSRTIREWLWRMAAALLAYPIIYLTFGLLVEPFIREYYASGAFELTIPTWGQLIPLQIARSALFLLVCLPVLVWWHGSKPGLWLSLGLSFFLLTAFMAVITAYWFPWQMRLAHGLELFADGMLYAGVLVWLLRSPE
jgi:hypothetical protein